MTSTMQKTEALLEEETRHSRSLDEQIAQLQAERENLLENQQQTISLLVSEKTQLSSDLERLEGIEAKAQATEDILSTERSKINRLEQQVHHLEAQVADSSQQNQSLLTKQKAQTDKTREQERELQLTKATVNTLRNDVEKHQSRVQELEAHIQSDDRAERLEKSLTNAQDRADELEFQLSKLKQVGNQE
ncbi:hypothetical protein C8J56DRAFT_317211 [Mycena floridula]|nr:hypothetical protein C8J56DRAFT_317211 [Mycena floridula]